MKKTSLLAAVVTMVMLLSVSLGSTLAYFTAATNGGTQLALNLGAKTHIEEDIEDDLTKDVTVVNDSENPVMVRVMVEGQYVSGISGENDNWYQDGNYWYYDGVLMKGESTTALIVTPNLDAAAQTGAGFSIVVTEESAQAYEEDGEMVVDWDTATAVTQSDAEEVK